MTLDEEKPKRRKEPSKQSNAPALKEIDLEGALERYPPEAIETLAKILETSDPAKIKRFTATAKLSYYQGDIFPAEILGEYERARPGGAQWVLDHVDKQMDHRHELERLRAGQWEARATRAQWFGFIVALSGIAMAGAIAITTGTWVVSCAIAVASIGGPAAAQLMARSIRRWMGDNTQGK